MVFIKKPNKLAAILPLFGWNYFHKYGDFIAVRKSWYSWCGITTLKADFNAFSPPLTTGVSLNKVA